MIKPAQPVALVTGAGRRLGLHMTHSLLRQGWRVIALTRAKAGALTAIENPNLVCLQCNPLNDFSVDKAMQSILQQTTHVDFILHNASIYEKDDAHSHDRSNFYDALYQIHMKLPARLNQVFAEHLKRSVQPHGNIIHITDIYVDNPNAEYALYCSTKAGAENLMKSYAKLLAPKVRVNAIQPGPVQFLPSHTQEIKEKVLAETLLAVEGGFEALEKAIYAILDNHYMTASVIRVDGGRALA